MKTEVTEEMIARAVKCVEGKKRPGSNREYVKWILESALNAPAEPEIVVTREQMNAGLTAYWHPDNGAVSDGWNERARDQIARTYRAMRALELGPVKVRAPCTGAYREVPCALANACCMNKRSGYERRRYTHAVGGARATTGRRFTDSK